MDRVTLDTGVLITGIEQRPSQLIDTSDIAIPAIVIAEFRLGCLLDTNHERAAINREYLDTLLEVAPTLEYDRAIAEEHATLLAHTRRNVRPRRTHDLIIAATAKAAGRAVATTDTRAAFNDLPVIECVLIRAAGAS